MLLRKYIRVLVEARGRGGHLRGHIKNPETFPGLEASADAGIDVAELERRKSLGIKQDNPLAEKALAGMNKEDFPFQNSYEWLQYSHDTATGYARNVWVSPRSLRGIPGYRSEHLSYDSGLVDQIAASIMSKGYDPAERPKIIVNAWGEPEIFEGNHRVQASIKAEVDRIPIDIDYEGGSEMIPDVWLPEAI